MIIKRILSWSVWMALFSVAAAQVAGAEQPIIIPVVLVVCQTSSRGNTMSRPMVQTAVYMQDVGRQLYATVPGSSADTKKAFVETSRGKPDSRIARRIELGPLKSARSSASGRTEISLPVVLKVVIDGEAATHVSVYHSADQPRDQWTEPQGPVIPATDLLTGRPTAVRSEYIKEYQQIVRPRKK